VSIVDEAAVLLPHLAALRLERVWLKGARVRIEASTSGEWASCPGCGTRSGRVHSRYVRRLADAGIGGRGVTLALTVRRLFCDESSCTCKTFAEQVPGLTSRYGRRTGPAAGVVESVAMALGGRAGARLVDQLAVPASRTTLLRVIRRVPDPQSVTPSVLGVDDFAQRRGHRYATILVDMHTHRPIDVLPDRDADTFADWLRRHPGVQVICRDRGGAYADGAARGAPDAIQVADRWHLMHNLSEAVRKVVTRHRRCLQQVPVGTPEQLSATPPAPPVSSPPSGRRAANTHRRHTAVQELLAEGLTIRAIMRRLGMSRATVRKYARAQTPEQLTGPNPSSGPGVLGPFKPYLQARHDEGVTDTRRLFEEIRGRGYRGTLRTLQRFMVNVRGAGRPPAPPPVPAARHITAWIMRPHHKLTDDDRVGLKDARARCPDLDALTDLAHGFNQLVRHRAGHRLEEWISQATDGPFPEIRGFATGLLADFDAVRAGLTLSWSSGPVEGNINRVKMIKRQMYGRAKLDLLRKRVLVHV
jgi:transposase